MGSRGQVAPLAALLLAAVAVLALAIGSLGRAAHDRARAGTAADAAALAGAVVGADGSRQLATRNGATIESLTIGPGEAEVTARVGHQTARARAEADPLRPEHEGLAPAMLAAIARVEDLLGQPVPIASGYRSPHSQQALWENRHRNPYPVAFPGTSLHERGLAIDIPLTFVARVLPVAGAAGLCRPLPTSDPVHFELCPPSATR